MQTSTSSPFYLCTGFHRSGTSLLAQTLSANGMHMGNELMGATFSNPLGHVEDMPMVRLHDKVYGFNGVDWRYHDTSELIKPIWLTNYIKRYCHGRKKNVIFNDTDHDTNSDIELAGPRVSTGFYGVKDPRAVHFLNDWLLANDGNIRFVFIYRHWLSSCYSLFKRHSRHLLNNVHPMQANNVNMSLWSPLSLSYQMWLSANKRMLAFYQAHPTKCVLVSQEALVGVNADTSNIATKIGLPEQMLQVKQYQASLISHDVPDIVHNSVDATLSSELDECYRQLEVIADLPCNSTPTLRSNRSVVLSCTSLPVTQAETINEEHHQHTDSPNISEQPALNIFEHANFNFADLTWSEVTGALKKIPNRVIDIHHYQTLISKESTKWDVYDSLSKVAHMHGFWLLSKLFKFRAMHIHSIDALQPHWRISDWSLYTQVPSTQTPDITNAAPQLIADWFTTSDAKLHRSNPFSVRKKDDLPERYQSLPVISYQQCVSLSDAQEAEHYLSLLLLTSELQEQQYLQVSTQAKRLKLLHIAEFCLFKAIRLANKVDTVIALGDVYFDYDLFVSAINCYAYALTKEVKAPYLLARISMTRTKLGHLREADFFLKKALNKNPKHPAVIKAKQLLHCANGPQTRSVNQLKHRFAVIPQFNHYDLVLQKMLEYSNDSITTDANLDTDNTAQHIDKYNQRVSFLVKNNLDWCQQGSVKLTTKAKDNLLYLLDKHWIKLWGVPLLDYMLYGNAQRCVEQVEWLGSADNAKDVDDTASAATELPLTSIKTQVQKKSNVTIRVVVEDVSLLSVFIVFYQQVYAASEASSFRWEFVIDANTYGKGTERYNKIFGLLDKHYTVIDRVNEEILNNTSSQSLGSTSNADEALEQSSPSAGWTMILVLAQHNITLGEISNREDISDSACNSSDDSSYDSTDNSTNNSSKNNTLNSADKNNDGHNALGRQSVILTWYALFGFDFGLGMGIEQANADHTSLENLHSARLEKAECDIILPSYSPYLLPSIQNLPSFYPVQHAFWYKNSLGLDGFPVTNPNDEPAIRKWLQKHKLNNTRLLFIQSLYPEISQ